MRYIISYKRHYTHEPIFAKNLSMNDGRLDWLNSVLDKKEATIITLNQARYLVWRNSKTTLIFSNYRIIPYEEI